MSEATRTSGSRAGRAKVAGLVSAALALAGCAARPATEAGGGDPARAAIYGLVSDFETKNQDSFFSRFDDERFPDYLTVRETLRNFLLRNDQINIELVIDSVLSDGDKTAVLAQWRRSFLDSAGVPRQEKGRCEFLLRRRASGELAVMDIRGDSPF